MSSFLIIQGSRYRYNKETTTALSLGQTWNLRNLRVIRGEFLPSTNTIRRKYQLFNFIRIQQFEGFVLQETKHVCLNPLFTLQILMSVNHLSPTTAMSTLCAQIQTAHMSAAAEGDTKEMEDFAKVFISNRFN